REASNELLGGAVVDRSWIELHRNPAVDAGRAHALRVAGTRAEREPIERLLHLLVRGLLAEYPQRQQLVREARASGRDLTASDSMRLREAGRLSRQLLTELQTAKVARAVMSNRQLEEVMVDFWENHFTVFAGKGPERYFLGEYERESIRPHALGKFRDLLGAVAKSPAMLYYLDNWESTVDSGRPSLAARGSARGRRRSAMLAPSARARPKGLNENYGRELLELHTLGVDGGYTQQDVINVARAFTGWTVEKPRQNGTFDFRPAMHDAGEKLVLGHVLPAGRGIEDGEEVLDIVSRSPSTAKFISAKLVRRFVSDSAPPALVDRVAATFTRTDGDIRECLRTIFTSQQFFSRAAYKAKVKSPFELVVSALRAVGAQPDSTPRTAAMVGKLGEPLYGHLAPNGYPERGDAWINTGAILQRINFGLAVAAGRVPGASLDNWPDGRALASAPHDAQVDGVIRTILAGEASPDTRKVLENGVNPMAGDSTFANARPDGFANIVGLALGAPEFQRR
ncbi:MAG: DUF1800 domain-containing protein, partial [Gemmatimonadales bacterium]